MNGKIMLPSRRIRHMHFSVVTSVWNLRQ